MEAGKYLRTEVQEEPDEVFDKELKSLFGEKYRDVSAEISEEANREVAQGEKDSTEARMPWVRIRAAVSLVVGAGLLLYMVLSGKIDTTYGLVFTAGISAACGYRMN